MSLERAFVWGVLTAWIPFRRVFGWLAYLLLVATFLLHGGVGLGIVLALVTCWRLRR